MCDPCEGGGFPSILLWRNLGQGDWDLFSGGVSWRSLHCLVWIPHQLNLKFHLANSPVSKFRSCLKHLEIPLISMQHEKHVIWGGWLYLPKQPYFLIFIMYCVYFWIICNFILCPNIAQITMNKIVHQILFYLYIISKNRPSLQHFPLLFPTKTIVVITEIWNKIRWNKTNFLKLRLLPQRGYFLLISISSRTLINDIKHAFTSIEESPSLTTVTQTLLVISQFGHWLNICWISCLF